MLRDEVKQKKCSRPVVPKMSYGCAPALLHGLGCEGEYVLMVQALLDISDKIWYFLTSFWLDMHFLSTPVLLIFSSALFLPHLTLTTLPSVLSSAATLPVFNLYVFSFSPNGLTLLSWLSLDSLLLPASHLASQVSVAASFALCPPASAKALPDFPCSNWRDLSSPCSHTNGSQSPFSLIFFSLAFA